MLRETAGIVEWRGHRGEGEGMAAARRKVAAVGAVWGSSVERDWGRRAVDGSPSDGSTDRRTRRRRRTAPYTERGGLQEDNGNTM